jgi:glutaredoxin
MFTVYSKPNCPYCDQSKALLEMKGEPFEVIMLDVGQPKVEGQQYISREKLLEKFPTARTVPQIIRSTENASMHVGGFTELRSLLHAG